MEIPPIPSFFSLQPGDPVALLPLEARDGGIIGRKLSLIASPQSYHSGDQWLSQWGWTGDSRIRVSLSNQGGPIKVPRLVNPANRREIPNHFSSLSNTVLIVLSQISHSHAESLQIFYRFKTTTSYLDFLSHVAGGGGLFSPAKSPLLTTNSHNAYMFCISYQQYTSKYLVTLHCIQKINDTSCVKKVF
jgi:hypothetical protein